MAPNVDSQLADAFFRLSLNALNEKPNASAVVSPFSIAMALATLNVGANDVTSQEISDHVFAGMPKDQIASWFRERLVGDNGEPLWSGEESPLSIASAIYLQRTLRPLERFSTEVGKNFDCRVERVDFAGAPQVQRTAINAFVEEATKGHIPEFLSHCDVSCATRLVAVNAMYLKINFDEKFQRSHTESEDFHNEDGSIKQVETMHGSNKGRLFKTDHYAYAEFPFENCEFNFFFVVPKTGDLSALRESFSSGNGSFSATTADASDLANIYMALPKFKVETDYRLKETSQRHGINSMYEEASLNGIAEESLHVNEIIHKVIFGLYEEGITAVAATNVDCMLSCYDNDEKCDIRADRPFLYGVTYNRVPFFVGQFY